MATISGLASLRRVIPRLLKSSSVQNSSIIVIGQRNLLTAPSGAIFPEPQKPGPFPILKVALVLGLGIYVGAAIAKNGATILEENEIFVPTDDEEED